MLVISVSALTGCGDSIKSVEPPRLEPAPPGLTERCDRPVLLPERDLPRGETRSYWATDRGRLVTCADRHAALVDFYEDRDTRIMGQ